MTDLRIAETSIDLAAALSSDDWARLGQLQLRLREQLTYLFELVVCYSDEIHVLVKVLVPQKSGPVPIKQLSFHVEHDLIPKVDKLAKPVLEEFAPAGFRIVNELSAAFNDDTLRVYMLSRRKSDVAEGPG